MANDHIADDRKKVRLIDANALMKYINDEHSYAGLPMAAHILTMELLTYAPTVDAVEVRCAKCKHYQQYHKGRTEELCEWGKCKLISMDIDMPSNGFCCFGEKRTE